LPARLSLGASPARAATLAFVDDTTHATAQIERVSIPRTIQTARLVLRPWNADDAEQLAPILEANVAHLGPWIPKAISTPAPVDTLRERLTSFAADFAADLKWRYAMLARDGTLLGDVGLFPRNAEGRVAFSEADRAEIGYWIRADRSGQGLVQEGVLALIEAASALSAFAQLEIRCDEANAPSGAIPQRLGFTLTETIPAEGYQLQVWVKPIERNAGTRAAHTSTAVHE
jgi:RimJ/RimL family protein N-acetyltransferase